MRARPPCGDLAANFEQSRDVRRVWWEDLSRPEDELLGYLVLALSQGAEVAQKMILAPR